jgi:hypothetical protein
MASTDDEVPRSCPKRRWFRFRWYHVCIGLLLFVVSGFGCALLILGNPRFWTFDYDRTRYNQIRRAIDADSNHLRGRPLDEIVKTLGLENVPWDDGNVQNEPGSYRIYHFRGFSLNVTLEQWPEGVRPHSVVGRSFTSEELQRPTVLWLGSYDPFILVDGIPDREERMRRFWKAVDDEIRWINIRRINEGPR